MSCLSVIVYWQPLYAGHNFAPFVWGAKTLHKLAWARLKQSLEAGGWGMGQGTVLSHTGQEWEGECSVVDGSVLQFGQFSEVLWNSDGCHDSSCDSHHHTGVSSFTCHLPNKPPVPKSSLWAPPWKERLCHIFFSMTTWVGSRSVVICKRNFPTGLYSWSGDPSSTPFQLETLEKPVPESQFPQMANCTCSD